jgi:hypothetical protein
MSQNKTWCDVGCVLDCLVGPWVLIRSIDNGASMTGTAAFEYANGQLAYSERGQLRLPDGQTIDGERRYLFEACDDGFSVLFAEAPPRLFHHIALCRTGASLAGSAVHLCGDDCYDSHYEFSPDGTFFVRHAVVGPRKAYTIETYYTRRC